MKIRETEKAEEYAQSLAAGKRDLTELRKDYEEVVAENSLWQEKVHTLEKQLIQVDI